MSSIDKLAGERGCRRWNLGLAALAMACGSVAWAQVVTVPAAHLHHAEGSVAHAPQGDKEWHDVQPRRLLKRGDRLWTDRGSRAEVQAAGHALRLDGETQLVLENVGETATQLSLTQGSLVATVTRMNPGDSFEVGTPNLAFRARQPGDYRVDVDNKQGVTRIVVLAGAGVAYGERGEALEIRNGQRVTFRDRSLTRVQQPAFAATDDFDRWSGARRRGEPTVTMPIVATAAVSPTPAVPDSRKTIVISGGPVVPVAKAAPAAAQAAVQSQPAPVARVAAAPVPAVRHLAAAGPMRVTIPAPVATPMQAQAQAAAQAQSQAAEHAAQAQAAHDLHERQRAAQQRVEQEQERQRAAQQRAEQEQRQQQRQQAAQQRAEQERQAAAARAEQQRRAAALEAKRAEERRQAQVRRDAEQKRMTARRAEEERRTIATRRDIEQKQLAARRAEEDRRIASARKAADDRRIAAAREAETQKLAEQARRKQLARLQEQAHREEQHVQARREQAARRAEDDRREEQARREDLARREDMARREEQARREEEYRRQRAFEQARRDHERREQEVWLRQQQLQPVRPAPMGVPARRVS
jgi:hypothetical protein